MQQLLTFIKNFKEVSPAWAEKMRKSTGNIVNIATGGVGAVPGVASGTMINRTELPARWGAAMAACKGAGWGLSEGEPSKCSPGLVELMV